MMRAYMQQLYDAVPFSIDAVGGEADWQTWRRATLKNLRRALGLERFPKKTPLKPRVIGVLGRGDYVVEKVVFETQPGFLMTANLYRPPTVTGRVPAVLCVHGHTMAGKTAASEQTRAINFARAGWVALALDATGHGERVHIGHRRTFGIGTTGMTLEGVQVWDNIRAVDYLLSRAGVDPARIGISGCSGGGNQTMYTAAMDERLAAAVPVCSVSTLRGQIFTQNGIGCQCECIPDLMRYGLENAVVCALIAPRPLLILSGSLDQTFPIQYTRDAHAHLERFYAAIGRPDRYRYVEVELPHGYQRPFRELAHAWFDRWFHARPEEVPFHEPDTALEEAATLWCFPKGELPGASATLGSLAHDLARREAASLKVPASAVARARLRRRLSKEVLGGSPEPCPLNARPTRPVTRQGVTRSTVAFDTEPGVTINAGLARPAANEASTACVVLVREKVSRTRWTHAAAFLKRGFTVAELDVRPTDDEYVSRAALVYGRPLVAMAAYDISRFLDGLEQTDANVDAGRVFLWAEGAMALPALYALALDQRLAAASLVGLLTTNVAPAPVQHPNWTFARGLLKCADVEHLAALAAPRPLLIANPVGPDLKPLPRRLLGDAFGAGRKAYKGTANLAVVGGTEEAVLRRAVRFFGGRRP